jgi:hypothetical protein
VDMAIMAYRSMGENGVCNESVSKGLHTASRHLRERWLSENVAIGALEDSKCRLEAHITTGSSSIAGQSLSRKRKAEKLRDVELRDTTELSPLYWAPYVHFGM